MWRVVFGLAFLAGIGLFLRHQYAGVIRQVTTKSSRAAFSTVNGASQESRRKCVICGGTGRAMSFGFGRTGSSRSEACRSCNGTGWVDNPLYGR